MTLVALIQLVKSLSASEKRILKLYSRKQAGNKDYLALYSIINENTNGPGPVRTRFKKEFPSASLNNTAKYLEKIIIDSLVDGKTEKDTFFQLLRDIMRVKVLQERTFYDDGLNRLIKLRKTAVASQQHWIEYFTYRIELDHIAESGFHNISDSSLIAMQMKAKDVLKSLNHIQDHHALFELLKYRLVNSGKVASEQDRKKMNDLMLSEMTLVAGKTKNSFLSNKLHLLFQSFFFMDVGDYHTALKTFHSLNKLFEEHLNLLDYPPLDYLSALNGIMDSLHTLKKTGEINFYIEKATRLDQPLYPEYFRQQVRKMTAVYRLVVLISEERMIEAVTTVGELEPAMLQVYNHVSEEKQWELYYYCSLAYLKIKNLKKAHDYIQRILQNAKAQRHMVVCKAIRLLNIIIYYEKGESGYLEYEARSYKRFFSKQHPLLQTEKTLLRFLVSWPDKNRKRIPATEAKKIRKEIEWVDNDKYEKQLLKYFNFTEWLMEKTGGLPLVVTPAKK